MDPAGKRKGPAGILAQGCAWTDDEVSFDSGDQVLDHACSMLWKISREIRSRRGVMGMKMTDLAMASGVRRQTVRDIQEGITWPDGITLARVCSILRIEIRADQIESTDQQK
jgi:DNA-binding XRE family transcriptional regulator